MKAGWKTLEFWSVVILGVLAALKQSVLPDIPDKALYDIIVWILIRSGMKAAQLAMGNHVPLKEGIKTSEGIVSTIAAPILGILKAKFPLIPSELFTGIAAYTIGRGVVKSVSK